MATTEQPTTYARPGQPGSKAGWVRRAVTVTPAAREAIMRLQATHGALAFFQSGGCCDGSLPICLADGELAPGPDDLLLGSVVGSPFYVNREQYERWGRPQFVVDLAAGPAEGFSLSERDAHFVTRTPPASDATRHGERSVSAP